MQSWTASFTMLTACSSTEKACVKRTHAPAPLTNKQTPEPITTSARAGAHHRLKRVLTIARNHCSPSAKCACIAGFVGIHGLLVADHAAAFRFVDSIDVIN